jgi:hypothetical protein
MDAVRSLLLLRPGDTPPADPPDATLLDLTDLQPDGYTQAAAASASLLQTGHRLYLHTHLRQNASARANLLACYPTIEPPADGDQPPPTIYGLSLAGLTSLDQLRYAASLMEDLEAHTGATPGLGAIGLWIDSARALHIAGELAGASSRLTWIGIDARALATELGIPAGNGATLDHARAAVVLAAQANDLPAVEGPAPRDDSGGYETSNAERLRALGLRGHATWDAQTTAPLTAIFPDAPPPD